MVRSLVVLLLSLTFPGIALAASGGPDAAGWTWADTAGGGSPYLYEFADVDVIYPMADDDSAFLAMPFSIDWYGTPVSSFGVQSNGLLTVDTSAAMGPGNQCPLGPSTPGMIVPYWDDLPMAADGLVAYGTLGVQPNRVFIVEWSMVGPVSGEWLGFEVKIFEQDGRIEFHYLYVDSVDSSVGSGASATVGIAGPGGALDVSCDLPSLSDGYAITFFPPTEQGDDDDATGDDDDATGDDDDATGDDDDATGDDDDATGDDDDATGDDDDATGDDDDSAGPAGDDDDDGGGGRSRATSSSCAQSGAGTPIPAAMLLGLVMVVGGRRPWRRRAVQSPGTT